MKSIHQAYRSEVARQVDPAKVESLKKGQHGHPLLLGLVLDQCVKDYLEAIRLPGCIVSR